MSRSSGARWESQLTDGTSEQSGARDGAAPARDPSRQIAKEHIMNYQPKGQGGRTKATI